jgi:hypothetical protein
LVKAGLRPSLDSREDHIHKAVTIKRHGSIYHREKVTVCGINYMPLSVRGKIYSIMPLKLNIGEKRRRKMKIGRNCNIIILF